MAIFRKKTAAIAAKQPEERKPVVIAPLNLKRVTFLIVGTSPYVQNRFSEKAKETMTKSQEQGSVKKVDKKVKAPRNFENDFMGAMHLADDGWHGAPSIGILHAIIDVCPLVGWEMTTAKKVIRVVEDGYDAKDQTPLCRLQADPPKRHVMHARNRLTTDLRVRPMWAPGWKIEVTIEFDADIISEENIANLLDRAGQQIGIGEGRRFSKMSVGQGWGTFMITKASKTEAKNGKPQRKAA